MDMYQNKILTLFEASFEATAYRPKTFDTASSKAFFILLFLKKA